MNILYCALSPEIDKNILYTLDYIYKTDAMLVSFWKITVVLLDNMGRYRKEENERFTIITENYAQTYNTLEALYCGIINYF
jgi:hypothetical protein